MSGWKQYCFDTNFGFSWRLRCVASTSTAYHWAACRSGDFSEAFVSHECRGRRLDKITEKKQGNGVYIMDFEKDKFKVQGNTPIERLQNAVKDFLKQEKATKSSTHTLSINN